MLGLRLVVNMTESELEDKSERGDDGSSAGGAGDGEQIDDTTESREDGSSDENVGSAERSEAGDRRFGGGRWSDGMVDNDDDGESERDTLGELRTAGCATLRLRVRSGEDTEG
jgi:hypothetical protein